MKNKYYKYYQPNKKDLKDKQNDCSIRALTKFFGYSWVDVFDNLVKYARETQTMISSLDNIKMYMEECNIPYVSIYKPKDKKVTVLDFVKQNNSGIYTLYVRAGYGTHLVAVADGIYYDTWDCGDRIVYGYWKR